MSEYLEVKNIGTFTASVLPSVTQNTVIHAGMGNMARISTLGTHVMVNADYGLSVNEQAAGRETLMIAHEPGQSVVDVALVRNNAYGGPATPLGLGGGCIDACICNEQLYNTAIAAQLRNHQAVEEGQPFDFDAQQHCECVQEDEWDYVVEVWPGISDDAKGDHIFAVQVAFENKNIDYHLTLQDPVDPEDVALYGPCRRYALPRQYRNSEHSRLKFLQVFGYDRQYNRALGGYWYKMSVVYEGRNPLPSSRRYSSHGGNRGPKVTGFNPLNPNGDPTLIPSTPSSPSISSLAPTTPPNAFLPPPAFAVTKAVTKAVAPKTTQPRMKPIPKPDRQVVKNREGRYLCTWRTCTAAVRDFARRCEWNKHMDKHERPYKCQAEGCENIPGFTYSGGLLRHEREVHNKHGGPKNPLFCPHKGCKRHKNSSFARLENLNEHLRRCHTSAEAPIQSEEPDTVAAIKPPPDVASPLPISPAPAMPSPRIGSKRKAEDDDSLREEVKRLRSENHELKRKIEAGYLQQSAMMEQIDQLEKEKSALLSQLKGANLVNQPNPIL
ncbi:hypothetical protein O1611_g142 [Lasiodiplodia mahajangana]|uniref:Uncharacterized protein n=1 Tax=Lasiodiplodia mahajangana TaxID=1108764 RepID=A0ACC2K112_9PEZI|nr:hypothetical protein O1611_g142 [Lasiodiplodia mahajangana]